MPDPAVNAAYFERNAQGVPKPLRAGHSTNYNIDKTLVHPRF
jgi:hypothetical protein